MFSRNYSNVFSLKRKKNYIWNPSFSSFWSVLNGIYSKLKYLVIVLEEIVRIAITLRVNVKLQVKCSNPINWYVNNSQNTNYSWYSIIHYRIGKHRDIFNKVSFIIPEQLALDWREVLLTSFISLCRWNFPRESLPVLCSIIFSSGWCKKTELRCVS